MALPKRKRTDSQSDSPLKCQKKDLTQSTELYLDDGNIVLIAEDVAFRVHKSQLARHSEVFRDMFACADPPKDSEVFDGCQAVRLSEESDIVLALLQALYDFTQFHYKDVPLVAKVFQMATKYIIESLRLHTITILQTLYPDTLRTWDSDVWGGYRGYPHLVIKLVNAELLIPAAYYELCAWSMKKVFDSQIPPPVLETYCKGKDQITLKLFEFIDKHLKTDYVGERCVNGVCCGAWKGLGINADLLLRKQANCPDPLAALLDLSKDPLLSKLCQECRSKLEGTIATERDVIWKSLPATFGLGSWKNLRQNA